MIKANSNKPMSSLVCQTAWDGKSFTVDVAARGLASKAQADAVKKPGSKNGKAGHLRKL